MKHFLCVHFKGLLLIYRTDIPIKANKRVKTIETKMNQDLWRDIIKTFKLKVFN